MVQQSVLRIFLFPCSFSLVVLISPKIKLVFFTFYIFFFVSSILFSIHNPFPSVIMTWIFSSLIPSSTTDRMTGTKMLCLIIAINGIFFTCLSKKYFSFFEPIDQTTELSEASHLQNKKDGFHPFSLFGWGSSSKTDNDNPSGLHTEGLLNFVQDLKSHPTTENQAFFNNFRIAFLWSLCASFFYAIFMVAYSSCFKKDSSLRLELFLGFVGLFIFILFWPGIAVMHFIGFETFTLPNLVTIWYIAINAFVTVVIGQIIWLYGVLYTSNLIGTLSLILQIPLSLMIKLILNLGDINPEGLRQNIAGFGQSLGSSRDVQQMMIGFIFIICSFALLVYASSPHSNKKQISCPLRVRTFCSCSCHQIAKSLLCCCWPSNSDPDSDYLNNKNRFSYKSKYAKRFANLRTGGTGSILSKRPSEETEMKNLLATSDQSDSD